jgi:acetolactate synthase-1/2/3 large subunit
MWILMVTSKLVRLIDQDILIANSLISREKYLMILLYELFLVIYSLIRRAKGSPFGRILPGAIEMECTVSEMLLAILKKHGVKYICGLPAAQIGLIMDGASRDPDFKYVTTRHEEAAAHMAASISRVTDTMGVCFATVGPGASNIVPGVAAAYADNIPLLVITGQNQARAIDPSIDQLQSADQLGLFKSITKWNASIHHAERAPELVERAVHIARSGRPGPVHLDIPCDVGTQLCNYDLGMIPPYQLKRPTPSRRELQQVVEALSAARKPLLIAGGGVARSGAVKAFRLVEARYGACLQRRSRARPSEPNNMVRPA